MLSSYPACFIKEDIGYSVIFPDLGIATCGDDLEEASAMAIDCLAGYLYSPDSENENIPSASKLEDISSQKIMNELEVTSEECFVKLITVDVMEYAKTHFTSYIHNKEDYMGRIITNKIRCKKCGDIIESKTRHDFRTCNCGAVAVDGGYDYLKRTGNYEDWEELSEVEQL